MQLLYIILALLSFFSFTSAHNSAHNATTKSTHSHISKSHTHKSHTPKSHTQESHASKSHASKSHASKSHASKSHASKSHTHKSHSPKSTHSHTPKSHTHKSHASKSHIPKSHTNKSHASKSHAPKSTHSHKPQSAHNSSSPQPGYLSDPASLLPASTQLDFKHQTAFIYGDLMTVVVESVASSHGGKQFIQGCQELIDAIHTIPAAQQPLNIFTRIYFSTSYAPELSKGAGGGCCGGQAPFTAGINKAGIGNATATTPETQVDKRFNVKEDVDIVLQKTRFYAGYGNDLEGILRSQGIQNVVIGGISASGVVLDTVYRLIDLDYNVFVVSNNTIETPPDKPGIIKAILEGIIPKTGASVITVEQALNALK